MWLCNAQCHASCSVPFTRHCICSLIFHFCCWWTSLSGFAELFHFQTKCLNTNVRQNFTLQISQWFLTLLRSLRPSSVREKCVKSAKTGRHHFKTDLTLGKSSTIFLPSLWHSGTGGWPAINDTCNSTYFIADDHSLQRANVHNIPESSAAHLA